MVDQESRYRFAIYFESKSGDFLGLRPRIDTTPRPDDRFHTVVEGDRLDFLAHKYLGNADLWWLICDYNDIFFPLELKTGLLLRLPSSSRIGLDLRQGSLAF